MSSTSLHAATGFQKALWGFLVLLGAALGMLALVLQRQFPDGPSLLFFLINAGGVALSVVATAEWSRLQIATRQMRLGR